MACLILAISRTAEGSGTEATGPEPPAQFSIAVSARFSVRSSRAMATTRRPAGLSSTKRSRVFDAPLTRSAAPYRRHVAGCPHRPSIHPPEAVGVESRTRRSSSPFGLLPGQEGTGARVKTAELRTVSSLQNQNSAVATGRRQCHSRRARHFPILCLNSSISDSPIATSLLSVQEPWAHLIFAQIGPHQCPRVALRHRSPPRIEPATPSLRVH